MNADYYITAAETLCRNAEEMIEKGYYVKAKQYYKIAASNYRKAAAADKKDADKWNALADDCESNMNSVSTANDRRPASAAERSGMVPQRGASAGNSGGKPSEGKKPEGAKGDGITVGEDEKPDFSGYNIDISLPKNKVSFDDIVGLQEAKQAIRTMLINPIAHPEAYKKYGLEVGGFILLYGPPGTGKTTFAKAAASQLGFPFVSKSCNSLISKYIGETGKNIAEFFSEVRRFVKEQNTPIILYLDEIDEIAKASGESDKVADEAVPALKTQLDGFDSDNENIFIIAATNLIDKIDSAIKDRFTKRILIPLPERESREKIFHIKLEKTAISPEDLAQIDFGKLADATEGLSGRDIEHITKEFLRLLADRDAGEMPIEGNLTDVLLRLVEQRRIAISRND